MAFIVRTSQKTAGDRTGDVYELSDSNETTRIEVWPQWGFNCLEWQVRQPSGEWARILHKADDWAGNPVPTRSGHPILFPFPGRLRNGTLTFEGQTYSLPRNDSTKQHAIHGFTPRNPWRVINMKGGDHSASITGQFSLGRDLPESRPFWPADFELTVTYQLKLDCLRVEASVVNLGPGALPFGLGYHPYFRLPGVENGDIGEYLLQTHAEAVWETEQNLPTGLRKPVSGSIDFRQPNVLDAIELDHVFTTLEAGRKLPGGLRELARLSLPGKQGGLQVCADTAFRELVLFTPSHRQAVAIEPYTCSADAPNLAAHGVDSGWKTLRPAYQWDSVVEYHWRPNT